MTPYFLAPRCAAAEASHASTAPALELQASPEPNGAASAVPCEARAPCETSAELDYGCVDWFIYGAAEVRIISAVLAR